VAPRGRSEQQEVSADQVQADPGDAAAAGQRDPHHDAQRQHVAALGGVGPVAVGRGRCRCRSFDAAIGAQAAAHTAASVGVQRPLTDTVSSTRTSVYDCRWPCVYDIVQG